MSEFKGNPTFLNEDDKSEFNDMQNKHEIDEAKNALENAKILLEKAKADQYADSMSAEALVELRQAEYDKILKSQAGSETNH